MSSHDHYLELGALAAVGQISADEDWELCQHLLECDECREACSDYSAILHRHLPNVSPVRFRLKHDFVHTAPAAEIRGRFLARARSEGAEFSSEVEEPELNRGIRSWRVTSGRLAWATATVSVAIAIWAMASSQVTIRLKASQIADLLHHNELLNRELLVAKQSAARPAVAQTMAITREGGEEHERSLRTRIQVLREQLSESQARAEAVEKRLAALQAENGSLSNAEQQDQAQVGELQKQLAHEKDVSTATIAALVDAQDKIRALNTTINEGSQRLAMEQQLNAASSDVRQLMGARNLHIIDVHDVSVSGKSAKSFGRVFYSEGQSLVFYAFDLPAKSPPARYFFKAWGQMEASERSVHDLGVFSVDDHERRRWVLKVNDARLLKGIDSVFVTAEVTGDSTTPKGKRILYAYLVGPANHP